MEKEVIKQLNINISAELSKRIGRYVYENETTKTAIVIQSVEKFLKSKGY
jgi:hypothetical protein